MDYGINRITLGIDSHRYMRPAALYINNPQGPGQQVQENYRGNDKYSQLRRKIKEMYTIIWFHQDLQSHLVLWLVNIWSYKTISNQQEEWSEGLQWTAVELAPFKIFD